MKDCGGWVELSAGDYVGIQGNPRHRCHITLKRVIESVSYLNFFKKILECFEFFDFLRTYVETYVVHNYFVGNLCSLSKKFNFPNFKRSLPVHSLSLFLTIHKV